MNLLESLSESNSTTITRQVKILITKLCGIHRIQCPSEVDHLKSPEFSTNVEGGLDDPESESEEEEYIGEDNIDMEMEAHQRLEEDLEKLTVKDDLSDDKQEILRKWTQQQFRNDSKGNVMASVRLQKELKHIWRSEPYKTQQYTIDLLDDSLYDWHVRLLLPSIDPDSALHTDLVKLKSVSGKEGILLHIRFKDSYPLEPPFVRVVEPVITSKLLKIKNQK